MGPQSLMFLFSMTFSSKKQLNGESLQESSRALYCLMEKVVASSTTEVVHSDFFFFFFVTQPVCRACE